MKVLNEVQKEQIHEILEKLQRLREQKSLSIEDISAQTLIRPTLLKALEAGKFEDLPESIYVKGFIRRYGDVVGSDGNALAQYFEEISSPPPPELESEEENDDVEEKVSKYLPIFLPYVLVLALLVTASVGLFYIINSRRNAEPIASEKQPTATTVNSPTESISTPEPTTPTATIPTATTPTPSPTPEAISNTIEVTLELQGESWLRVKVDGKTEFEGILKKGDRKTWKGNKQVFVRSGNAGAVLVSLNQKQAKPLGKNGAVENMVFTLDSDW
ncbi:MAG: DUF4115 domain-containing protein [Nostocaceae cyanobacterium]|nr:DUF4115 domain-containing protein [Nostocaceae cyanobacterium]